MTVAERSPFGQLMRRLCPDLGLCGTVRRGKPLHVSMLIPREGRISADEFACLAILADGGNPFDSRAKSSRHRSRIAQYFVECFDAEWAHVSELTYSDADLARPDEEETTE
ncbi:hypothetical protein GCM10007148_00240 [Parvularcula lutaonensis]|nr:hypothetical protein GCM10007148_00240 [Parvularcula lutaonensis]